MPVAVRKIATATMGNTNTLETAKNKDASKAGKIKFVSVTKLIEILKNGGIRIGRSGSDTYNTLRYYTKIGLLPHMVRKFSESDNSVVGHYPLSVVATIRTIEDLKKQGLSNSEIFDHFAEEEMKELDRKAVSTRVKSPLPPVIFKPVVFPIQKMHGPRPTDVNNSINNSIDNSIVETTKKSSTGVSSLVFALSLCLLFLTSMGIFLGLDSTHVSKINTFATRFQSQFADNFVCNVSSRAAQILGIDCSQTNEFTYSDEGAVLAKETRGLLSDATYANYEHAAIFSDPKYATMRLENFALEVDGEWVGPDFLVAQSRGKGVFYLQAGGDYWSLGGGNIQWGIIRGGLLVEGISNLTTLAVSHEASFAGTVGVRGLSTLASTLTTGDAEFRGGLRVTDGNVTIDGDLIVTGPQTFSGTGSLILNPNGNLYFQSTNYYITESGNLVTSSLTSPLLTYEGDILVDASSSTRNTSVTVTNPHAGYIANFNVEGDIKVNGGTINLANGETIDAEMVDVITLTSDGNIAFVLGDELGGKELIIYDSSGSNRVFSVDSNGFTTIAGGAVVTGDFTMTGDATITGDTVFNGQLQVENYTNLATIQALTELGTGALVYNQADDFLYYYKSDTEEWTVVGGGLQNAYNAGQSIAMNASRGSMRVTSSLASEVLFMGESTGFVGIGTTNPRNKLDVLGKTSTTTFQMTNGGTAGYVLVSDASGNASWVDVSSTAGPWNLALTNLYPDDTSYNVAIGATDAGNAKLYVNGNVGIGTTAPQSMLSVGATSQFQVNSTGNIVKLNNVTTSFPVSQGVANSFLRNDGTGTLTWADPAGTGVAGFWQRNGTSLAPTNIGDNVGIGTTAPGGKLAVEGGVVNIGGGSTNSVSLGQLLEVHNVGNYGGASFNNWTAGTNGMVLDFQKSRSGTIGTHTALQNNDEFGYLRFRGSDGSAFRDGAYIWAQVDGTVTGGGAADMPGRLTFYTTPDGSATSLARMVIKNNGNVGIGTTMPRGILDVYSTISLNKPIYLDTTDKIHVGDYSNQNTNTYLTVDAGGETFTFNNGYVGIGYANPGFAKLAINGNVGIGTTSPGVQLEVVGDIISKGTSWTIRTSAADNVWREVVYGNGLFVAVSQTGTGNRVMTSPDGIIWTIRTSAANNSWFGLTYGNGLFVAVANTGTGNRVMTSSDGITWTARASAADNNWQSVTYGNGLFVAVSQTGTGNRVMTSPDGMTWTTRTSAADNDWQRVIYGNGLFVAVANTGTGNRVMTSPDGITWTTRTSAADSGWFGVTYGNGLFVAVANTGTDNRVMTSPDGITWTTRTVVNNDWYSVTYGNGLFVAVSNTGIGNRVMTSLDGITWTIRTSAADNNWYSVTYGNGLFVAVANSGIGNRVMTSGKADYTPFSANNIYQGGMNIFGNVGIGTTAPRGLLDVFNGTSYFGDSTYYLKLGSVSNIPTIYGSGAYTRIGDALSASTVGADASSLVDFEDDLFVSGNFEVGGSFITPYAQTITVAKSGGDFTTINAAYTYAKTLTPGATNQILVKVMPGVYEEKLTMDTSYISLSGSGQDVSKLKYSNTANAETTLSVGNLLGIVVSDLTIEIVGNGSFPDTGAVGGSGGSGITFRKNKLVGTGDGYNRAVRNNSSVFIGNILNSEDNYDVVGSSGTFYNNILSGSSNVYVDVAGTFIDNHFKSTSTIVGGTYINNTFAGAYTVIQGTVAFRGNNWLGTSNHVVLESGSPTFHGDIIEGYIKIYSNSPTPKFHNIVVQGSSNGFSIDTSTNTPTIYLSNSSLASGIDTDAVVRGSYPETHARSNIYDNSSSTALNVYQSSTGDILNLFDGTTEVFSVLDGGNVGIGNTAPSYKLDVNGDARISTLAAGATDTVVTHSSGLLQTRTIDTRVWGSTLVDGSGTANYVSRWTDGNTIGIGTLYDTGTNVGIGTTAPQSQFEIFGTNSAMLLSYDANNSAKLSISSNGTLTFTNETGGVNTTTATISSTGAQFNVPATFASSGDVLIANDLTFSNGTAAYINFNGPGYIRTSHPSASNDLTLSAANAGVVYVDDGITVAGNVLPSVDVTHNLGSTSYRWASVFANSFAGAITPTGFTQGSVAFAGSGGTLTQDNANLFWDDSSNRLGIGTTGPGSKLSVANGHIDLTDGYGLYNQQGITTAGTYGFIPNFGDNTMRFKVANAFAVTINSGGNVGIGTTNPAVALAVSSSLNTASGASGWDTGGGQLNLISTAADANNVGPAITFLSTASGVGGMAAIKGATDGTAGNGYLSFLTRSGPGASQYATERMRITNAGNVGIGTTGPGAPLEVSTANQGSAALGFRIRNPNSSNGNGVNFYTASDGAGSTLYLEGIKGSTDTSSYGIPNKITSARGSFGLGIMLQGGAGDSTIGADRFGIFQSSGGTNATPVELLSIIRNGNVGIGTTGPTAKLQVSGFTSLGGNQPVPPGDTGGNAAIIGADELFSNAKGLARILTNDAFAIDKGGSIAFGGRYSSTAATDAYANWAGIKGAKETATDGEYGGYLSLGTRPQGGVIQDRVRITSTGNVGIGTTSPGAKLDVNGGIKLSGTDNNNRIDLGYQGPIFFRSSYDIGSCSGTCTSPWLADSTSNRGTVFQTTANELRYGPYVNLPPGSYRVTHRIKVADNTYTGNVARIYTYIGAPSTGSSEDRYIKGTEFTASNKWQNFSYRLIITAAGGNNEEMYFFGQNNRQVYEDYIIVQPYDDESPYVKGLIVHNDAGTNNFSVDPSGFGYFAGNVGIGTAAPIEKFELSGTATNALLSDTGDAYDPKYKLSIGGSTFTNQLNIASRPTIINSNTYYSTSWTGWSTGVSPGCSTADSVASPESQFKGPALRCIQTAGNGIWATGTTQFVSGHVYRISFKYTATAAWFMANRDDRIQSIAANTGNAKYYSFIYSAALCSAGNSCNLLIGADATNTLLINELWVEDLSNGTLTYNLTADPTGNVGIGTAGPGAKLQVNGGSTISYTTPGLTKGTVHIQPNAGANDDSVALTFGANNGAAPIDSSQAGIYVQSSGAYGTKMYFATTDSYATGSKARMMIDHLGNVGIGTTGPGYRLDVSDANAVVGRFISSSASGTQFLLSNTDAGGSVWDFLSTGSGNGEGAGALSLLDDGTRRLTIQTNGGVLLGSYAGGATAPADGLAISGNVGIGTAGPADKLQVSGRNINVNNYGFLGQLLSGEGTILGHNIKADPAVNNQMIAVNTGYYGQAIRMYYDQGIAFHTIATAVTAGDVFNTTTTERMRITKEGNVGIGTAGPLEKLEIAGNAGGNLLISDSTSSYTDTNDPAYKAQINGTLGAEQLMIASRANMMITSTYYATSTSGWNPQTGSSGVSATTVTGKNFKGNQVLQFTGTTSGDRIWANGGAQPTQFAQNVRYRVSFRYTATNAFNIGSRDDAFATVPANTGNAKYYSATFSNPYVGGCSAGNSCYFLFTVNSNTVNVQDLTVQNLDTAPTWNMVADATGNVGIGTTGPGVKLDVAGTIKARTAYTNSALIQAGDWATMQQISTTQSMFGRNIYYDDTSWKRSNTGYATAIRMYDDPGDGSIAFHLTASGTAGTTPATWDSTDVKMMIRNNGSVGINDVTPDYKLDVNGTIRGFGITDSSDTRFKKNVTDLEGSLSRLLQLKGVSYNWIDETTYGSGKQLGFIAQDVEPLFPELVSTDSDGYKSIAYGKMAAVIVSSIQEQQAQIASLSGQLANLSDVFTVTTSGNVGIGTTGPSSPFTINKNSPSANSFLFNVQNTGANKFSVDGEGDFFYDGTGSSPSADVAEIYPTSETGIVSGEIVSLSVGDSNAQTVIRSGMASDPNLLGVVTTKPALLLGSNIESGVAVALIGRVPVKVNDQNGIIAKGDYITSSSTPGVGMKATSVGMVVGRALSDAKCASDKSENLISKSETNPNGENGNDPNNLEFRDSDLEFEGSDATACTVSVFMNVSWFDPAHSSLALSTTPIDTSNITDLTLQTLSVLGSSTFVNATVTGSFNVGLLSIEDSSINVAGGVLKLQDAYGSGNIEAFGGKIVMTTDGGMHIAGRFEAKQVVAGEFTVATDGIDDTIGQVTIPAGQKTVVVKNTTVTGKSKVFITPRTSTDKTISVTSIIEGESFTVELGSPSAKDIVVDYFIVGVE